MRFALALAFLLMAEVLLAQQGTDLPQGQITFRVVTDNGQPVPDIPLTAHTFLRWQPGEGFGRDVYQNFTGKTDEDGTVAITFNSERGNVRYGIYEVPGYYSTRNLEYQFEKAQDNTWRPWNPTIEVVLKPIMNPIPMHGRRVGFVTTPLELPAKGRPVGFDLIAGDWVRPYGRGSISDLVFTLTVRVPFTSIDKPYDETLIISFSNSGDGIQSVVAPPNQGSDLRLPRYAPEDGYEPTLQKHLGRPAPGEPIKTGIREDQNYFFRVRTVLDEHERTIGALYGKVIGDIACDVINSKTALIQFAYCLNPNSNDRNMEFDPRSNLAADLPFSQRVTGP